MTLHQYLMKEMYSGAGQFLFLVSYDCYSSHFCGVRVVDSQQD